MQVRFLPGAPNLNRGASPRRTPLHALSRAASPRALRSRGSLAALVRSVDLSVYLHRPQRGASSRTCDPPAERILSIISAVRSREIDKLVDSFVLKVNARQHEHLPFEDVPQFLRRPSSDDHADADAWTDWEIHKTDNSGAIEALETRIGRRFPYGFRSLITRYSFPAFECGPLLFYANTGENTHDDLTNRLFHDPHMSPVLLSAGYVQIGNPCRSNYDPICFAPQPSQKESPLIQLDHESILQFGKIKRIKEIAPSFVHLLSRLVGTDEMPASAG